MNDGEIFSFPEDWAKEFIYSTSLYTHLLERELINYTREAFRKQVLSSSPEERRDLFVTSARRLGPSKRNLQKKTSGLLDIRAFSVLL
jgi:hypothetical protein